MPETAPDDQARPRVVFFGSGPVAAASLQLLTEWCDIEAVITKPQPAHHKEIFPVIAVAERQQLPLLYASNRRELDDIMAGQQFTSKLAVLIDYGIIVSQQVIDSFALGIVNSHFSLLPEWRGADPISFAILSGQAQTGVSLMLLVQAMDEGPLLSQGIYDIPPDSTTPLLTAYLIKLSDSLLRSALPVYISGKPLPNGHKMLPASQQAVMRMLDKPFEPTYSRKLSKQDGQLDFAKPAAQLEREIRAFIEWPKSHTVLAGKQVVITKARVANADDASLQPVAGSLATGKAYATTGKAIVIPTSDGLLVIERLKPAGKPEMAARDFLNGNTL